MYRIINPHSCPCEEGLKYMLFVSMCLFVTKAHVMWQSLSLSKNYYIYSTQLSTFQHMNFPKMLPSQIIWILLVFVIRSSYPQLFYYNYNCHMIIRLYTNCDYINTLYYMLLEIQVNKRR